MEVGRHYLADKSALARLHRPEVAAVLAQRLEAGTVHTCSVVEMEILFSARNYEDFMRTLAIRRRAFPLIPIDQQHFDRATEVMGLLAQRGHQRAVGLPDLLLAAVAERAGVTLLHYDADFDLVASATGQATEWVVPRGTVP